MAEINFVDTTLRDGNQSLWGLQMKTGMVLSIAHKLDQIGFKAIEPDAFMPFKLRVRQREEPWERIQFLARAITRTPLSILTSNVMGQFREPLPLALCELRAKVLAAKGIRRVQITGSMNDLEFKVPQIVRFSREAGMEVVIGLVYGESPRHTDDYYARKTREAAKLKPDSIYLKDPIGLLTPERTRTIIPAIVQNSGGLPVELHSHCTTGLAPLCYLEAVKLGVRTLHTGIPPLANGSALPSVLNVAKNARLLGYGSRIDESAIKPIADHFSLIARREGLPIGVPLEYDYAQYIHHVPGGVISNLRRQLAELRVEHRLDEVLAETLRVRQDLGYPIMYTPFSQYVVTQATMNVVLGERYKEVADDVIRYVLGRWGKEASLAVNPEVQAKILDRRRAKELAAQEPVEPSMEKIRQTLGGPGIPDDELLLRYILSGDEELKAIRPAPPVKEYSSTRTPLTFLVQELLKHKGSRYVSVEKPGLRIILGTRL